MHPSRHFTRSLAVVGLGIVTALVPAAAGASVAAAKNGCKYLKVSEVSAVLGVPITKTKPPLAPSSVKVCGYKVTDDQTVNLWVQSGAGGTAGFSAAKQTFAADIEPVTGLGSKAFYVGNNLNTVYLLKGDTLVYVQYVTFGGPDAATVKDAVTKLAKTVRGRV
jgi:hypothetical protein